MSCWTPSTAPAEPRPGPSRPWGSGTRGLALLAAGACLVLCGACRTTADRPEVDAESLADPRTALSGPLPGDLSALYHLRVPSSGALRLAVLERGGEGRLTVSEPFGGAVSVTSWAAGGPLEGLLAQPGLVAIDDMPIAYDIGDREEDKSNMAWMNEVEIDLGEYLKGGDGIVYRQVME